MFSFCRNRSEEAAPFLRKIIDLTTPNQTLNTDCRMARRYNRSLPVVYSPWTKKGHDSNYIGIGFTSDMSDAGIGIITQTEIEFSEIVVALFLERDMDVPWYFRTQIRTRREPIQGFNHYGLQIEEFLNDKQRKKTRSFDETVWQLLRPEQPV